MIRKPPIRTYERKKAERKMTISKKQVENFPLYHSLWTSSESDKSNTELDKIKKNCDNEYSFDNDPFETTFDRIAKDAVVPPIPQIENDTSWTDSSYENIKQTKDNESLLFVPSNTFDTTIPGKRKLRKKEEKDSSVKRIKGKLFKSKENNYKHKKKQENKKKPNETKNNRKNNKNVGKTMSNHYRKTENLKNDTGKCSDKNSVDNCKVDSESHKVEYNTTEDNISSVNNNTDNSMADTSVIESPNFENRLTGQVTKNRGGNVTHDMSLLNLVKSSDSGKSVKLVNSDIKPCFLKLERCVVQPSRKQSKHSEFITKPCTIRLERLDSFKKRQSTEDSFRKGQSIEVSLDNTEMISNKPENNIVAQENLSTNTTPEINSSVKIWKSIVKNCYVKLNYLSSFSNTVNGIKEIEPECVVSSTPISKYRKPVILFTPISHNTDENSVNYHINNFETDIKDPKEKSETEVSEREKSESDMESKRFQNSASEILADKNNSQNQVLTISEGKLNLTNDSVISVNESLGKNISERTDEPGISKNTNADLSVENNSSKSLFDDSPNVDETRDNSSVYETSYKTDNNQSNRHLSNSISNLDEIDQSESLFDDKSREVTKDSSIDYNINEPNNAQFVEKNNSTKTKIIESISEKKVELEDDLQSQNSKLIECQDKVEANDSLSKTNFECSNTSEPLVHSTSMQNFNGITDRRERYISWKHRLNVLENCDELNKIVEEDILEDIVQDNIIQSNIKEQLFPKHFSQSALDDYNIYDSQISQVRSLSQGTQRSVFLKPGKFWVRSLSILNNIQDGCNMDILCIGKGKKWRHSVQDVFDMQKQGIIQTCTKNVEDNKDSQSQHNVLHNSCQTVVNNVYSTETTNCNRFSRRVSVRVVPDNKNNEYIKDTPFLEAYGIASQTQRNALESVENNVHYASENLVINENISLITAREVVLQRCGQTDYIQFEQCFPDSYLQHCRKIGEGVYGEVFLYELETQKSVIKIIPIEGDQLVNGEPQKKFNEILSEIVIAKELHNLRFGTKYQTDGFVEVKNVHCIIGKYPEKLVKLWQIYDEEKTSDNDCPSMFDDDQLYIVFELGHSGLDLEAFIFQTAVEAHALFVQTAMALAVAEKCLEFEHRDLHWGNVLISRTDEPYVYYKLDDKEIQLPTNGVKVSIIDFTLSRMSYQGCCIFNDLALDPALFNAEGEYQFDIYRFMRDKIENNWQEFEPYTNLLWLHYTLDKMIMMVRYKRKNLKIHKNAIAELKELKNVILDYKSSYHFVTNCDKVNEILCNKVTLSTVSSCTKTQQQQQQLTDTQKLSSVHI